MKTSGLLLGIIALLTAYQGFCADTLEKGRVSVTGSIIQETVTGLTVTQPITIKTVLGALELSGSGAPSTLGYCYDENRNAFVIVPKSAVASGSGTPIATVLSPDTNPYVNWKTSGDSAIGVIGGLGLGNFLNGNMEETSAYPNGVETDAFKFVFYGTILSHRTIMKGTLVHVFSK
jgi:hypothetical protein